MVVVAALSCNVNGAGAAIRFPGDLFTATGSAITSAEANGMGFEIEIAYDSDCRLWRRTDYVTNTTSEPIRIDSLFSILEIPAPNPQLTIMRSAWSREAQAEKVDCVTEALAIESSGRSCYYFRPYAAITSDAGGVVLNLLPVGDWRMTFDGHSSPGSVIVEIGRPEGQWEIDLAPGERYEIGISYLVQITHAGDGAPVGHCVQRYALEKLFRRSREPLPVVYNTWFDRFHKISWESLTTQLDAAVEVGCVAFVVNAGWFGPTTDDWFSIGDWRENPQVFGKRGLVEFADLVRSKGLGFGMWMEPERVKRTTPIYAEHPDWFVQIDTDYAYTDLVNPAARKWMKSEIARLIETYKLSWLTIDANQNTPPDHRKRAHELRIRALYEILDEIAERYPELIIEGCASGGLRADLLTASHFHTHFLSDTVDPAEDLRISISVFASLPPRLINRWAVLYPTNHGWTIYNRDAFDTGDLVLCPGTGRSDKVSSYELDFAVRAAMTGVMGIGGNIAGLDEHLKQQLAGHIAFYKEHRAFIQNSIAVPLTPVESIELRSGVAAVQLSDCEFHRNMVFLYNIASRLRTVKATPFGLDRSGEYRVLDEKQQELAKYTGAELLSQGLDIECGSGQARVVFVQLSER